MSLTYFKQAFLLLVILVLSACGSSQAGQPPAEVSADSVGADLATPKDRPGNPPQSFHDYFMRLPNKEHSLPDWPNEDAQKAFLNRILANPMQGANYVFDGETDEGDMLKAWFHLFENEKQPERSILVVETSYGSSSTTTFWRFEPGNEKLVSAADKMPRLNPEMFLPTGASAPTKDIQPQATIQDGSGEVTIFLNTWMSPDYENVKITHDVSLVWNGEEFQVERTEAK